MKNWLCILLVLMVGAFSASAITRNAGDGNVLGAITNGSVFWAPSRLNLYAPVEGYSLPRPSLNTPTYLSLGYRTRPVTAVGYVQLGKRPYELASRAFMCADPYGHLFDPAWNTAFYGNPASFYDPEGLFGKQLYQNSVEQANGVIGWADDMAINTVLMPFALGNRAFGLAARGLNLDPSNFDWQAQKVESYMSPYARAGYYNDNKPGVQLATFSAILVNPELALSKLGSLGRTGIALESETALWRIGRHGDMPSPRPTGYESHHGVNSVWMEENVAGYSASDAPAVLMKNDPFHNATRGVFNQIRNEIAARQGVSPRNIDWSKVSPGTAWRIAEEQLQAAKVPANIQEEYFRQFNQYLESLR